MRSCSHGHPTETATVASVHTRETGHWTVKRILRSPLPWIILLVILIGALVDFAGNAGGGQEQPTSDVVKLINGNDPLKTVTDGRDPSCLHPQIELLRQDARIKEAQNAKRCLPSRRPFHPYVTLFPLLSSL